MTWDVQNTKCSSSVVQCAIFVLKFCIRGACSCTLPTEKQQQQKWPQVTVTPGRDVTMRRQAGLWPDRDTVVRGQPGLWPDRDSAVRGQPGQWPAGNTTAREQPGLQLDRDTTARGQPGLWPEMPGLWSNNYTKLRSKGKLNHLENKQKLEGRRDGGGARERRRRREGGEQIILKNIL